MNLIQKRRIANLTLYFFVSLFFITGIFLKNVSSAYLIEYFFAGSFVLIPGLLIFISRATRKNKNKN